MLLTPMLDNDCSQLVILIKWPTNVHWNNGEECHDGMVLISWADSAGVGVWAGKNKNNDRVLKNHNKRISISGDLLVVRASNVC